MFRFRSTSYFVLVSDIALGTDEPVPDHVQGSVPEMADSFGNHEGDTG